MKKVKLSDTNYAFGHNLKVNTTINGDVLVGDFPGSIIQARLLNGTVSLFFIYDKAGVPLKALHIGGSATFAVNDVLPGFNCFYSGEDGLHITNNTNFGNTILLKVI